MGEPASIQIWDPVVRGFHWTLAAAVITDYWFTDPGSDLHDWIGYLAAAAVVVRIVWGFIGSGYARFDSFTPSRARIREHLRALSARQVPLESGHNPLGALMIYVVFFLIAILTVTGWMHEEIDALFGNDLLQEIHELAAHLLWIAALVHVASVIVVQYAGRVELIRPMITGRRRPWR
ncbi:MAG: cytochrome b/b6 domain-containing protein [Gammaproteobacteria bacterium]|nr:cytochrome b/b6 domain-containing protein [Gammaproteobacteria bacterium]